ncbi:DNA replication protein [Oikeobacillus pervagus]|uniref:DNA replication protein n=1 Tax=Oikeobacillus pervagus TaxID=1325931 RepID=A0AAJ1WJ11_9BACI|nr:DnaD domain-containing protein [Oikeobacillus pervagus]MDQ0213661.1 DNA replication protein [Oikeobacillus pervagus]
MENKDLVIHWMEEGMVNIPHILLSNYTKLHLTESELVLLLQIYAFKSKGNGFPTPEQLAENMTITSGECAITLRKLIQQHFLAIEEGDHPGFEKYSLKPLWRKLADFVLLENRQKELEKAVTNEKDLYTCFEQEFGRPLSPLECETLAIWLDQDHHDAMIIKTALREAVISGKLNFRYIDRILFEWKKQGIETIEQARVHGQRFRQNQNKYTKPKPSSKTVPFYNWLGDDTVD